MKSMKSKIIIATMLLVSMILSSCKLFPTQKMIDNIIPNYDKRTYTVADLIPYKYKEIKNALASYGMELQEYFSKNTSTESELSRTTDEEKNAFYKELMYMTHNYKVIKQRYAMYFDEEGMESEETKKLCEDEYNTYYNIGNAESFGVINKYTEKSKDMPLMSIRADMSTATISDVSDFYSEVVCEIYKPVYIDVKKYNSLKVGSEITLDMPATNSTVNCSEMKKLTFTYVATDSLLYKDDKGNKSYYFIADVDGTNDVRRVLDYYGKTIEVYQETKPLQFLKRCRVAEANDVIRILNAVISENFEEYRFGDIAEKALCGGYLVYKYKDYVYANSVTINKKGYITAAVEYTNQRIDNEFYKTLNK